MVGNFEFLLQPLRLPERFPQDSTVEWVQIVGIDVVGELLSLCQHFLVGPHADRLDQAITFLPGVGIFRIEDALFRQLIHALQRVRGLNAIRQGETRTASTNGARP